MTGIVCFHCLYLFAVFLAGCVQECEMTFSTSGNTSIPPQAAVRIPPLASPNSGLAVSLAAHEAPLPPPTESDGPDGLKFNLPAVKSGEACHVGVVLKAPPVNAVLQRMLPAEEADVEVAWKYLVRDHQDMSQMIVFLQFFQFLLKLF